MSIRYVGPSETFTDVQDALDDLFTTVGGGAFTEPHYIQVKLGSTASDIVVPSGLSPTVTNKLFINGEFRDRPVFTAVAAPALQVTTPNTLIGDIEIDGAGAFEGILVDEVDNFECYRNIIRDSTYLVRFDGTGTTGHKLYNCDLYNFDVDGIYKNGGDIEILHCSGLNKDDSDPAVLKAFIHTVDIDMTVKQSAFYVEGTNSEHYIYYLEERNPPFSTLDLERNLYWTGYTKLGSLAKVARRDVIDVIVDHERVTNISGTTTFTDSDATFTSLALNEDDVLTFETSPGDLQLVGTIVSSANIGQYLIKTLLSDTELVIDPNTTAETGDFEYTIERIDTQTFAKEQMGNWSAATGDSLILTLDPDFADLGFEGTGPTSLYPGAISPMIQYGLPLTEVMNDIDGNVRPDNVVTIGAHESRGTYTFAGVERILELIGGLSTQGAYKFCIGEEGELSFQKPEAPDQGAAGLDAKTATVEIPIATRTVTDGGLLTISADFHWIYLLHSNQVDHCDLSELKDQVIDEFTEMGIFTEDDVMLFRLTFPRFPWDVLSPVIPRITAKLRFEGKFITQAFHGGIGYRCPNDEDLPYTDWYQGIEAP